MSTPAAKPRSAAGRGPGRPPTRSPLPQVEKKGIVDAPKSSANQLEFVYDEPAVFKQLFMYLKNVKAREIHVRCMPTSLTFFVRNHAKTSRIVAKFDGSKVNWLYSIPDNWLCLNRESVEKIFTNAIDATHYKITLVQTVEDPDALQISLKEADVDKTNTWTVKLSVLTRDETLYDAEKEAYLDPDTIYPIDFSLSAKQLKKSVNDVAYHSDTMTIEKTGGSALQFTYSKSGISYREQYGTDQKINLRSSVASGEIFRVSVSIDNIKSISSSMVTESTRIICRKDCDLLFKSAPHKNALEVSTLVQLSRSSVPDWADVLSTP